MNLLRLRRIHYSLELSATCLPSSFTEASPVHNCSLVYPFHRNVGHAVHAVAAPLEKVVSAGEEKLFYAVGLPTADSRTVRPAGSNFLSCKYFVVLCALYMYKLQLRFSFVTFGQPADLFVESKTLQKLQWRCLLCRILREWWLKQKDDRAHSKDLERWLPRTNFLEWEAGKVL